MCTDHHPQTPSTTIMTIIRQFVLLSTLASLAVGLPSQEPFIKPPKAPTSLPVVLWHGLGDTYDSKGMAITAAKSIKTNQGPLVNQYIPIKKPGEKGKEESIGIW